MFWHLEKRTCNSQGKKVRLSSNFSKRIFTPKENGITYLGSIRPWSCQGEQGLALTLLFDFYLLELWEKSFCCFELPSLWRFVKAALGSELSVPLLWFYASEWWRSFFCSAGRCCSLVSFADWVSEATVLQPASLVSSVETSVSCWLCLPRMAKLLLLFQGISGQGRAKERR